MSRLSALWRANIIAFISSFCVMVIELIASRILAPYIGVSLYTWTSIIGVILGGIALGNYLGGRLADRRPSPLILALIFFTGALLTIAILPATMLVSSTEWFNGLPMMLEFTIKTSMIFFLPAIVLSMVSPMVIKLTLGDLGRTGGVVGTIYAVSTAGAILGTFMTGFFFILWFGTRLIVWLVAGVLVMTGIIAWLSWKIPGRWRPSLKNLIFWMVILEVIFGSAFLFLQFRQSWDENYTRESNYYTIRVMDAAGGFKVLSLDHLIHSYVIPDSPTTLKYDYVKVFEELFWSLGREKPAPRLLHLGGGGYSFPRYLETVYPATINEVVEIDPAVTEVAHEELGLPEDTSIKTYNQDARYFLMRRDAEDKYDFVIGDVFNDRATPYHLTTLEFDRLVKDNMTADGVYLINIVDSYQAGRYLPSFIFTLGQVFDNVYLFTVGDNWQDVLASTFVIAATDGTIDVNNYVRNLTGDGTRGITGLPMGETALEKYMAARKPVLLTDDYVPTDILVTIYFR